MGSSFKTILAIDPGKRCGLAIVQDGKVVRSEAGMGVSPDAAASLLANLHEWWKFDVVVIEQPPSVQHGAFAWWRNVMMWVLPAERYCSVVPIMPSQWQSWAGLLKGLPRSGKERRVESLRRVKDKALTLTGKHVEEDEAAAICLALYSADQLVLED